MFAQFSPSSSSLAPSLNPPRRFSANQRERDGIKLAALFIPLFSPLFEKKYPFFFFFPEQLFAFAFAADPNFFNFYLIKRKGNLYKMVLWFFGYGSLVWNPGFQVDEKVVGFIKDYRRVFDLACIDHRGTPEHPARTCTLEEQEGTLCWGAAYCVRGGPEKEKAAIEYLERRECEYDHKTLVDFYKEGDSEEPFVTGVIVFTSTPDKISNKYYLGPAPLEDMARQIATANGPCGNNRDYLFLLEKALFDIGHEDDYVIELANEVRKELGIVGGVMKEKKLTGQTHVPIKSSLSPLKLMPLPGAIAMDS